MPAKSTARGAAASSTRKKRGTSATKTSTEPTTQDQSTEPATAQPQLTGPSTKTQPTPDSPESAAPPVDGDDELSRFAYTYIVSVFKIGVGEFAVERALVEMPAEMAFQIATPDQENPLVAVVIQGVHRDLARIAAVAPDLADSALSGTAIRMALELENPYNSATSKAQLAKSLLETMEHLRSLTPDGEEEGDALDAILQRGGEAPLTIVK